jgi:ribosomal protein S18 acetylase RimI-like enzyme
MVLWRQNPFAFSTLVLLCRDPQRHADAHLARQERKGPGVAASDPSISINDLRQGRDHVRGRPVYQQRRGGVARSMIPPPCHHAFVLVRVATVADAPAIAAVHVASSEEAYAPLAAAWPLADVGTRTEGWTESFRTADARRVILVAELDGAVVGFVEGGPARRADPLAELEIYVIHVLPAHRGKGVGDALWTTACERLRGPERASLYVDSLAELRCCSFYERHGGQLVERRPTDFHGATRTHVTYRWASGAAATAP